VNAEIEARSRTNVLSVPIQSVTTRLPKESKESKDAKDGKTNAVELAQNTSGSATSTDVATNSGSSTNRSERKPGDAPKPIEVVFVAEGDHVKTAPVKRGIADDSHVEIVEGLKESQEVVSGGYKAISRELEDGKKIRKGAVVRGEDKEKK
jgi:HlyD family secretion protein